MMPALLYLWAAHPGMAPRPEAYFLGYWTTMPRPLPAAEAKRRFLRLVRAEALLQVRTMPARDLFEAAAARGLA